MERYANLAPWSRTILYLQYLKSKMETVGVLEVKSTKVDCGCDGSKATYEILTPEQIEDAMKTLKPIWQLTEDGKFIQCDIGCKHWKAAIDVINAVSEIAERKDMQHHPDINLTSYRNLNIKMTTNSVNALTSTDFRLAREIDSIPVEYSPKWLKSHPELITATENS